MAPPRSDARPVHRRRRPGPRLLGVLFAGALLAGCAAVDELLDRAGGSALVGEVIDQKDPAAVSPGPDVDADADAVAGDGADDDPGTGPGADGEDADDQAAAGEVAGPATEVAAALDLGLPGITLLTPAAGEGPRPVLRWEPVPGADSYLVILRDGVEAAASWVWRGSDTQVRVGYVTDPGFGGPELQPGMVWSVLALDDRDLPVAQSGERPIAP